MIHQAIAEAYGARGVAHISIPPDIFARKAGGTVPSLATLRPRPRSGARPGRYRRRRGPDREGEDGGHVLRRRLPGRRAELAALADRLLAPLMHTFRGKELMPYDDPHWIGGVGLIGGRPGSMRSPAPTSC